MRPKLLTCDDRSWIEKRLELFSPTFSEMSVANCIAYQKVRPLYTYIHKETLLFLLKKEDSFLLFGEPIGSLSSDEAILELGLAGADRTTAPKKRIEGFSLFSLHDDADYILDRTSIQTLSGHEQHRKRQLVQGCIDRYAPTVLPLEERQIEGCLLLNQKQKSGNEEKEAVDTLLHHHHTFSLFGSVVLIENQVEGFLVGEKLNRTTVNIHALKVNHEIHGLAPYLLHSFANNLPAVYTYLNMQQDLGIKGIRTAKERWHPIQMTIKYAIKRRAD